VDRDRLGPRLEDKAHELRGRNGRAARRPESLHRLAARPQRELALIEVPSALGLHPSGVQDAPDALREAGLHRLLKPTEVIRVEVAPYLAARDTKTHLLNPEGISFDQYLSLRASDSSYTFRQHLRQIGGAIEE
jgi:hypothetical protein